MRSSLNLPCYKCHVNEPLEVPLMAHDVEWTCANCGEANSGSIDGISTSFRILIRSAFHFKHEEYALSITMAAMAFECELARLYIKWEGITAMDAGGYKTDEDLEREYRNLGTIKTRIGKTSKLLNGSSIVDFVNSHADFRRTIEDQFPSLSVENLVGDIEKALFWPRNRFLHVGKTDHITKDPARSAHNIAQFGIELLEQMDETRRANCS